MSARYVDNGMRHRAEERNRRRALGVAFAIAVAIVAVVWRFDPRFRTIPALGADPGAPVAEAVPIPLILDEPAGTAPERPQVPIAATDDVTLSELTIAETPLMEQAPVSVPSSDPGDMLLSEGKPLEGWMVEERPVEIRFVIPEYPMDARRQRVEGDVVIELVVGTDGHVENASVLRGPEIFRRSAIEAALRLLFRPAMRGAQPVRVRVVRRFTFRLG